MLIKNTKAKEHGKIYFYDIGDYLSQRDKLNIVSEFGSVNGISKQNGWTQIVPDTHGDWLAQRDSGFTAFIPMVEKAYNKLRIFHLSSNGLQTNRDAWCYNSSKTLLAQNMQKTIAFYNSELDKFNKTFPSATKHERESKIDSFVNTDEAIISWSSSLIISAVANRQGNYSEKCLVKSLYRPFTKDWLYYDGMFNHRVGKMPELFPTRAVGNRAIMVKLRWSGDGFFAVMVNAIPGLQADGGAQNFPLYLYEESTPKPTSKQGSLLDVGTPASEPQYTRRDAITDEGLKHFQDAYPSENISKEDIFYYVYGLLHSEDYRTRYADNLSKELPRIPCVGNASDFWAFSKAGRELADLHINYETVEPYPATVTISNGNNPNVDEKVLYRVEKMRFGKKGKDKDKSIVHYNNFITVSGIPERAYDYVVNGKSAIDWVMERQCVKTDKSSGIVNDANDWANETVGDAKYPLELLLRVITVSLKTLDVVAGLPAI